MERLYIIEGTSNSGKTTTAYNLKQVKNLCIFPEFMEHPLAPSPSKNIEQELENQKKFYQIEKERMIYAKELLLNDHIVFFDRSYLSILAVSYAFEKLNRYKAYDNALNLYNLMIKEEWFIKPEEVFILTASHKDKIERNYSRKKELKENWIKEKFEYYQNEFYDIIELQSRKRIIDTSGKSKDYASRLIIKELKMER